MVPARRVQKPRVASNAMHFLHQQASGLDTWYLRVTNAAPIEVGELEVSMSVQAARATGQAHTTPVTQLLVSRVAQSRTAPCLEQGVDEWSDARRLAKSHQ